MPAILPGTGVGEDGLGTRPGPGTPAADEGWFLDALVTDVPVPAHAPAGAHRDDPLRDEGIACHRRLRAAGSPTVRCSVGGPSTSTR